MTMPSRSWLFTPATRPERFERGWAAGADRLIIDLEDAVAPDRKDAARSAAFDYLGQSGHDLARVALRINALDMLSGLDDLSRLVRGGIGPGLVLIPKAESADCVALVDRLLAAMPATRIGALIETAIGLENAGAIARASPRLDLLMLGAADMSADLGADGSWESLAFARGRIVAAAKAAGVMAVDSPWFAIDDVAGLERETAAAKALGFDAKAAIHPRHVAPINQALTPTSEAVEHARRVLAAASAGAAVVDGRMIDEAMARRARRVLALAGMSG